ncbi:hypothetical protein AB3S75_011487 [Citrus x aurantiifolia]
MLLLDQFKALRMFIVAPENTINPAAFATTSSPLSPFSSFSAGSAWNLLVIASPGMKINRFGILGFNVSVLGQQTMAGTAALIDGRGLICVSRFRSETACYV